MLPNDLYLAHSGLDVIWLSSVAEELLFDASEQLSLLLRVVAFGVVVVVVVIVVVGVVEERPFFGVLGFGLFGCGGGGVGRGVVSGCRCCCCVDVVVIHGGVTVLSVLDLPSANALQDLVGIIRVAQREEPGTDEGKKDGSKRDATGEDVESFLIENILERWHFAFGQRKEFLAGFVFLFRFDFHRVRLLLSRLGIFLRSMMRRERLSIGGGGGGV